MVTVIKIARAITARLFFAIHGLIVLWRVSSIYEDIRFWIFGVCIILLFLEGALLILQRQGDETRWFCLSVFLYLCSVVPPIWFLQYELCRRSIEDLINNATSLPGKIIDDVGETAKIEFIQGLQFEFFIPLNREIWVQLLQQTMLLILILGRWILPKGDVSRDHLSQLLLVFLAMAADMVELFDTFKEKQVKYSLHLTTIVLAVWSVSLIQFPLVLTGKASRKSRLGTLRNYSRTFTTSNSMSRSSSFFHKDLSSAAEAADHSFCRVLLTDVNFWGVLTSTLLQDIPFLVIRLFLLIVHHTISYTMIFFTCKNILVVALQCYRLIVVCCETHKDVEHCKFVYSMSQTTSLVGGAAAVGGGAALVHAAATNALTMMHDEYVGDLRQGSFVAMENKGAIEKEESKLNMLAQFDDDCDDLDDGDGFQTAYLVIPK